MLFAAHVNDRRMPANEPGRPSTPGLARLKRWWMNWAKQRPTLEGITGMIIIEFK